jgi:hypothetical protein
MISGSYRRLKKFEKLISLIVKEDVLRDLGCCCELLGYLPCRLEEIKVCFSFQHPHSTEEEMQLVGSMDIRKHFPVLEHNKSTMKFNI